MKVVEPIRNLKKLQNLKKILKEDGKIRDLLFIQLGLVTALRAWDILRLTVADITNSDGKLKKVIEVKESKTGKINRTKPTKNLKEAWELYQGKYPHIVSQRSNYIIFRTKIGSDECYGEHPITMRQAHNIITKATESVWLQGNYGTHSLRKTFGYQARIQWVPVTMIQKQLNHSSPWVTLDYIGITQQELDNVHASLDL